MRFAGEQPSGNAAVRVYRFQNAAKPRGAYVIWRPTSDGSTLPKYTLTVGGRPTIATLVTLAKGKPGGVAAPLPVTGGRATLAVSECPVLVLVNRR